MYYFYRESIVEERKLIHILGKCSKTLPEMHQILRYYIQHIRTDKPQNVLNNSKYIYKITFIEYFAMNLCLTSIAQFLHYTNI